LEKDPTEKIGNQAMRRKLFFTLVLAIFIFSCSPSTHGSASTRPQNETAVSIIAGCVQFPSDNVWNAPVDNLPVDSHSNAYLASIGTATGLHPDFGSGLYNNEPIGIPYNVVPGNQPVVSVTFDYDSQSDHGLYPIPPIPLIEGGPNSTGDRHILIVDKDNCKLYELFSAYPKNAESWQAGSGAIWNLASNLLRPDTWTSADAAGLPILPGLVRYDEVAAGKISHALRFTANITQMKHVWPARHDASSHTETNRPPMGQRFRLKANFNITGFSHDVQVILQAMKTYGIILADNGSDWYISGAPDERWNNDDLVNNLKKVHGADFEAVDETSLMVDPNSGQVKNRNWPNHLWLAILR
jgi:hypothetical protein